MSDGVSDDPIDGQVRFRHEQEELALMCAVVPPVAGMICRTCGVALMTWSTHDERARLIHWAKRDDVAVAALTGILAKEGPNEFTPDFVATRAYEMADAMLRAREPKKETHG